MPSKVVARRSNIHGTGVFARQDIKRGERIIEYRGTRRSHEDVDAGEAGDAESGHTFLFTLNDDWVIDGDRNGNVAKWINFSCSPNAEAVLEEHDGDDRRKDRVFIEAKRNIKAGDELTYDYNITLDVPHTARLRKIWECRCGAPNCKGTMLKAPAGKAAKKAAKKTAKKAAKKAATRTGAGRTAAKKTARTPPSKNAAVARTPARKAAKKAVTKRLAAKKAVTKRLAAKKAGVRTATAKKAVAKKAVSKKAVSKKAVSKKAVSKKAVAKKAIAKKAMARKRTAGTAPRKTAATRAPRRAAPVGRGNGARR